MIDYTLTPEQLTELRTAHRQTRDKREADRIKAVVLLATSWSADQVADVLQIDPNTARNHFKRYRQGGLATLREVAFHGSACALDAEQLACLNVHLQNCLYLSAKGVAQWVKETFGVAYTESGMTALLHRLDYVYKKPKLVPGKANPDAQQEFLAEYEKLKQNKEQDDPMCFMDQAGSRSRNPL